MSSMKTEFDVNEWKESVIKKMKTKKKDLLKEAEEAYEKFGDQFFEVYRLKYGRYGRDKYKKMYTEFYVLTADAYISGIGSCSEAMGKFRSWLKDNFPKERAGRIFNSVDLVIAYT